MYAVIEAGGKQHRVAPGDVIDVELIEGASAAGDKVTFERVLLIAGDDGVTTGSALEGASVHGVLVREFRTPKVLIFKKKKRKGYRRTQGHRQNLHRVQIESISA